MVNSNKVYYSVAIFELNFKIIINTYFKLVYVRNRHQTSEVSGSSEDLFPMNLSRSGTYGLIAY